jgi:hypothetical protein
MAELIPEPDYTGGESKKKLHNLVIKNISNFP